MKLIFHRSVLQKLKKIKHDDESSMTSLMRGFRDLEKNGKRATQVKKLTAPIKVFRKRVGVWRILFTEDGFVLRIWVVDRKKGPKDYRKWINFVMKKI